MKTLIRAAAPAVVFVVLAATLGAQAILNVSYDSTRDFYQAYNAAFAKYWKTKTGKDVTITQNHGASGAQAAVVIEGLAADVVTLEVDADVDAIATAGLTAANWQTRLPQNSAPFTSTIVFLVRKGNPKGIKDWSDLVKPRVRVIMPNPKSSGAGRWSYLAAWTYAVKQPGGTDGKARGFLGALLRNAGDLDLNAPAAETTFVQRGSGDVLLASESDAYRAVDAAKDKVEVVVPSVSIITEPVVAVVDAVVAKKGTKDAAEAYLQYLYSPDAQELAARFHYRPRDPKVAAKYASTFAQTTLFTVGEVFGGWQQAQKAHFARGGSFDQVYEPGVVH